MPISPPEDVPTGARVATRGSVTHWDVDQYPFRGARSLEFQAFALPLGPDHPHLNTMGVEPFSTSAQKVLAFVCATATKMCT